MSAMEEKSGNIAIQLLDRMLASRWGHTKLFVGGTAFVIAMVFVRKSPELGIESELGFTAFSMAVGLLAVAIVEAIGRALLKLVPCLAFRNLKPDLDTYLKTWRARGPERRARGYPPLEVQAPTIAARLEVLGIRFPGSTFEEIRDDLPDLIRMAELGRLQEARTRFPFDEDVD
ncbi:MAG: hypothetical protein F4205_16320 [Gemmatimonadetes bacterium]|nr:hypothetical protein [Gemmatimonadota bacterium]MYG37041.1 hypothetical protein [Gemmatimonadota bacterium]